MLKISSRGFDHAHTVMVILFGKQIDKSFAKITNG